MTAGPTRSSWHVPGALLLVQVLFGVHYVAAKLLLAEIPPRAWAPLRAAAAAIVLLGAARVLGRPFPSGARLLGRLALLSLFGVVINQLCFVEGLARTTPTHSSLINTTIPIWTLAFAVLWRQERAAPRKLAALGLASVGVVLVMRQPAGSATASLVGDLLTLANAISYSLFLVLSKRMLEGVDALSATAVLLAFGALGLLAPGLPALAAFDSAQVPGAIWWLGAFIVLVPTAGGYLLIYWALERAEPSVVALFTYLQPVIASALSIGLLGERPDRFVLAGAGLIFLAVYLGVRGRRQPSRSSATRASSSAPSGNAASSMSKPAE